MINSSSVDQIVDINNQDSLNIQYGSPTFLFGSHATKINEYVPAFYVTFNIHDMVLHNSMLDLGASHSLMCKIVMDNIGMDITRH